MANHFFRIAREMDYDEVSKHLLIVGELTGDCFSCREVGINYTREKYCPQCKTDFKYISYRKAADAITTGAIARICTRRPDLVYVEYKDIKEIADRQKVKNIFK
ncbi:MAG TPA: hypothetical protein DCL35_02245 [Candidatus Omnitrophica bacterium]|nr:hypothetical protein [Candidatus Omnitrophota bacterium]